MRHVWSLHEGTVEFGLASFQCFIEWMQMKLALFGEGIVRETKRAAEICFTYKYRSKTCAKCSRKESNSARTLLVLKLASFRR